MLSFLVFFYKRKNKNHFIFVVQSFTWTNIQRTAHSVQNVKISVYTCVLKWHRIISITIWIESDSNNNIFTFLLSEKCFSFEQTRIDISVSFLCCQTEIVSCVVMDVTLKIKTKTKWQTVTCIQFQNIWLSIIIKNV